MTIFIVVLQQDQGIIPGVFSTLAKAAKYIAERPYNSYMILERDVDKPE